MRALSDNFSATTNAFVNLEQLVAEHHNILRDLQDAMRQNNLVIRQLDDIMRRSSYQCSHCSVSHQNSSYNLVNNSGLFEETNSIGKDSSHTLGRESSPFVPRIYVVPSGTPNAHITTQTPNTPTAGRASCQNAPLVEDIPSFPNMKSTATLRLLAIEARRLTNVSSPLTCQQSTPKATYTPS